MPSRIYCRGLCTYVRSRRSLVFLSSPWFSSWKARLFVRSKVFDSLIGTIVFFYVGIARGFDP